MFARHTTRIRPRLGCRGCEPNRLFLPCGETFGQPSPYLRLDPYTSPLQGREHELDSQSGESRRIAVSASPFRTLTPHLYSQQLFVQGNATATANNIAAHETLFRLGIVSDLFTATMAIFLTLALYRLLK